MSKYHKKLSFSREIIFNKQGQIYFTKRILSRFSNNFFRFLWLSTKK